MGNYVIAVGNYVIATPSEVGNYKIADTGGPAERDEARIAAWREATWPVVKE